MKPVKRLPSLSDADPAAIHSSDKRIPGIKRNSSVGNPAAEYELVVRAANVPPVSDDVEKSKLVHKTSVPVGPAAPPTGGGRSRLASFNLPLFNTAPKNTAPKNMGFFSSHKRRGSLGKALQKLASHTPTAINGASTNESVVIDIDEEGKSEKSTRTDTGGKDDPLAPMVAPTKKNLKAAKEAGVKTSVMAPGLDDGEERRTRRTSESSCAKVSLAESRPSVTDSARLAFGTQRQRSSDLSSPGDAANVQQTERGLINLLDDFNAGRLRAFGASDASMALRRVRDMQERLARSHFEMYAVQEKMGFDNPKLASVSLSSWQSLMVGVEELSEAVQRLGKSSDTQPANYYGYVEKENTTLNGQDKSDFVTPS